MGSYLAFQHHPEWFLHPDQTVFQSDTRLPVFYASSRGLDVLKDLRLLGRLEVRRLGLSVLVADGDDPRTLALTAGHLPGSAAFGAFGNAVVAGHRDTSFWPLRHIRIGDHIRIRSQLTYDYVVKNIMIVDPDYVDVLRQTPGVQTLTIVTCYPFRYFGSAPKRFIVEAVISRT